MYADLETDIRAAAAAGYPLVELRTNKLDDYLKDHSVDDLKALLDETGVGRALVQHAGTHHVADR